MSWTAIEASITEATGRAFSASAASPITGGCINEAMRLDGSSGSYFVKLNTSGLADMFEAEAAGLAAICATGAIRAPEPVCWGENDRQSWLVMEYIEPGHAHSWSSERLGEKLAAMHRHSAAGFGWVRDNYIGQTPQPNNQRQDWVEFLSGQRLGFQLELARDNGAPGQLYDSGQRLITTLPAFFSGYQPAPSLLHGDLWGGNWACDSTGQPVIFDPAVYFGDREADLAMTELFGGFDDRFYHSYRQSWPIDPGYETRKVLYNLYHILNHFNLFGGGYAGQALGMVDRLLAEVA